ncbi:hypothetical protein [Delftia sp. WSY_22]|uniref:hypothetical protein n=1 Tax=Delftia sp. WSY_22 TaxID=3367213 RepID=UPI00370B0009
MKIFTNIFAIALMTLLPCMAQAKGWLDAGTTYKRYMGWACKAGSSVPSGIHIYADGQYIGGGNAAIVREFAVQAACNSTTSNHGFDIQVDVPIGLLNGAVRNVDVYAIYEDNTSEKLQNTPMRIKFDAIPGREKPANFGDVVGRDLAYSWGGPLNYFGHIGLWDGYNVLEAVGTIDPKNTIRPATWDVFSSATDLWKTISPVIPQDFRQEYCGVISCHYFQLESGRLVLTGPHTFNHYIRQMAARAAFIKYTIGASYAKAAQYTPSMQGMTYWTKNVCSPFSNKCTEKLVETKPARGVYRCETFVLDVWAATSIYGNPLRSQKVVGGRNSEAAAEIWGRQISYQTSWARVITPVSVYSNLQERRW